MATVLNAGQKSVSSNGSWPSAHRFSRSMSVLPELANPPRAPSCSCTARLWIAVERARASPSACRSETVLIGVTRVQRAQVSRNGLHTH